MKKLRNKGQLYKYTAICIFSSITITAIAQEKERDTTNLAQVRVVAEDPKRVFKNVPGTVNIISNKEIKEIAPISAGDLLRKVPGIYINDEEAAGLRLNIGIHGLNPQRSTKVLVLEDGIPVTLNPYGEPQMYFSPTIDRMTGVEVLKSSGQLLFGPQTVGGVVNFITANPPTELTNRVKINGGKGGFFTAYGSHGNTIGDAGYTINYLHKRADNLGPLNFVVNEATAKFNYKVSEKSQLGFKFGFYNEESNATYIGLTQTMYDAGNWDQVNIAPNDLMLLDKYSASLVHNYKINANIDLQTNAFAYYIRRNWRRQNFDRVNNPDRTYERIIGDGADQNSIFFREDALWRNRQYVVKGIEPRFNIRHQLFNIDNTLKTGVRAMWETAYEQAVTSRYDGFNGPSNNNEKRSGFALSMYAVNDFQITKKLSANVGFRIENYDMKRLIYKTTDNPLDVTNERSVFAFIPGAGVNYTINNEIVLFAGVHKGFAPPVLRNAINVAGSVDFINKEESVNYDLGARIALGDYLNIAPSIFYLDFQNQQIPVTLATAGSGFADGGKSKHKGAEISIDYDIARAMGSFNSLVIGGTFTYTDAQFGDNGVTENRAGEPINSVLNNQLPYSPKVMINNYVSLNLHNGLGVRVSGNYIGKQFTERDNIIIPSSNGTTGQLDARYLLDGNLYYTLKKKYTFNIAGKNLTNSRAIVTRHAQGIRVALDRFITAGVDITF
ncbi:TonB-dependent receptor family protein [Sphingobacterium rhinopitheci]|uniref:TonB-dependent receptor family protein n=1 Tax=Sphingobacterium rhinopitheci TaxID=2781960 RepID=UPI001F52686D|nr:TonB-dependent receptor [Sphingobacterium rhinopitheci]MCI0920045.1 TonB-dependent receptor [Sphingobacterium rhinopitheci]